MVSRLFLYALLGTFLVSAPARVVSAQVGGSQAKAGSTAPDTIEELVAKLGNEQLARFHFRQEKSIKSLKRPIVSEGEMVFERTKGIIWSTVTPRPSEFVITPYGITRLEEGQELTSLESKENPAVEAFTKVFLSLFRGDVSQLQQTFTLTIGPAGAVAGAQAAKGGQPATGWVLSLSPKDDRVGRFLKGLRLTGDRSISRVELDEANGDHASITLSQVGSDALTPAELKMLSKQ